MCGWGPFFVYLGDKLLPPILAASFGAYVLARVLENHRARRDFLSREVQDICASIEKYWGACREYWLPKKLPNQSDLEEKILYLQNEIAGAAKLLGDNFDEAFRTKCTELVGEMINEGSGGRFKDPDMQPDPERIARIRSVCLRLKQHLQQSRKEKLHHSGK